MTEGYHYLWTDQWERAFAVLHERGGHWKVAWGYRDPPGGDNYLQLGERETSDRTDALRLFVAEVRARCSDPDEVARVEFDVKEALRALAAQGRSRSGSRRASGRQGGQ